MRRSTANMTRLCRLSLLLGSAILCGLAVGAERPQGQVAPNVTPYLGFDANDYPGDAMLPRLHETFAFSGYWLDNPPGAAGSNSNRSLRPSESSRTEADTWLGHRDALAKQGFGFLVLFNGRLERELKSVAHARAVGTSDARDAARTARREGFPAGTIIFVDQEEGGSMTEPQMAYLLAWFDGVTLTGFRPGIYCSGIPASEGPAQFTITANYVREHVGARQIAYFVYDDVCPPAPGCVYAKVPPPSASGVAFASAWQFAQSPRRRAFTRYCSSTYNRDGNCYPPALGPGSPLVDLESATSPDPSRGR
jgi:hypothetical protein